MAISFEQQTDLTPKVIKLTIGTKGTRSTSRVTFHQHIEAVSAEIRENAINLENKEFDWLKTIVDEIKQDIKGKYKEAEIDLDTDTLPKLYLVPKKFRPQADNNSDFVENDSPELKYSHSNYHDSGANAVVVYTDPENISLLDIRSIHHELNHGTSTKIMILKNRISKLPVAPFAKIESSFSLQVGFSSRNKKFEGDKFNRGQMLEEGFVEYMSMEYLLESQNPTITKLKNEYLEKLTQSRGLENWEKWPEARKARTIWTNLNLDNSLADIVMPEYLEATKLIEYILLDAHVVYGPKMKNDLFKQMMRSRVNPEERRRLIDLMDKVYGRAFSRAFFLCPFDEKSIKNLYPLMTQARDQTRKVLNEQEDKLQ